MFLTLGLTASLSLLPYHEITGFRHGRWLLSPRAPCMVGGTHGLGRAVT